MPFLLYILAYAPGILQFRYAYAHHAYIPGLRVCPLSSIYWLVN